MSCSFCNGGCASADLTPLLHSNLGWLWHQVAAAADRRGDPVMVDGTLTIVAPDGAEERAAAVGLLGGRQLAPGQSHRVDLRMLTDRLRSRGRLLTPGAVAAHALHRQLATKARAKAARASRERLLATLAGGLVDSLPASAPIRPGSESLWSGLRRAGWVARLLADAGSEQLLRDAVAVLAALPAGGRRLDRRRLANDAVGYPHALDDDTPLARLVVALIVAADAASSGQRARAVWRAVGVDCDDLIGGVIAIGVQPAGWQLPQTATVTLPPRELKDCTWPAPPSGAWVFVTENPSVATAAADLAVETGALVRLLCTSGTPSVREVAAIGRLAETGWQVAVRADFDEAGIAHMCAILSGVPAAVPWRMSVDDYRSSLAASDSAVRLDAARIAECDWDRALAGEMRNQGVAAYEEALMTLLLEDLAHGTPPTA